MSWIWFFWANCGLLIFGSLLNALPLGDGYLFCETDYNLFPTTYLWHKAVFKSFVLSYLLYSQRFLVVMICCKEWLKFYGKCSVWHRTFSTKYYLEVEIQLIPEVPISIWILQGYTVLKMSVHSDSHPLPQICHFPPCLLAFKCDVSSSDRYMSLVHILTAHISALDTVVCYMATHFAALSDSN